MLSHFPFKFKNCYINTSSFSNKNSLTLGTVEIRNSMTKSFGEGKIETIQLFAIVTTKLCASERERDLGMGWKERET